MAPTRKSRSVNKRFSYPNEVSPVKDGDSATKSNKRKRKVSDMLGNQWSKEELQRFYEAYRKYGKDWRKVAATVRNRSVEMVEALYTMNRAYLSLPEGTASVVGLIAMMTDHYSVLEGSDSEQESNDGGGISQKPHKRSRGKSQINTARGSDRQSSDASHSQSLASNYGCLSLLKKRRDGNQPRAVGKRTPRIPIRYTYDKDSTEKYISPSRQGVKCRLEDDDETHKAALVLAEASHRGSSPQVSQTANKRREASAASPARLGERMIPDLDMTSGKNIGNDIGDDACEGSLGSTEGDHSFRREKPRAVGWKRSGTQIQQKEKIFYGQTLETEDVGQHYMDVVKEACSGTEEGQKIASFERKLGARIADVTSARSSGQTSKKRSKKVLFGGDEGVALDALQALADLSLMMPATTAEIESMVPRKDEKESLVHKSRAKEAVPTSQQRVKPKPSPSKKKGDQSIVITQVSESKASDAGKALALDSSPKDAGIRKRKPRSSVSKIPSLEVQMDSDEIDIQRKELSTKSRRSSQNAPQQPIGPLVKRDGEHSSSTTDIRRDGGESAVSSIQPPASNKMNLPTKSRSKRKLDRTLIQRSTRDFEISQGSNNDQTKASNLPYPDVLERVTNCLSNYQARRWCVYEWFYSAIDYPWFAKSEFVEYLYHVGLGHIPRLTRVEWDVIRSSLGKPRRFSKQFLREEKEKLDYYRESVRDHYTALRLGKREGLPTDLARPLTVGQRVIAIHPRSREVHNGNVLTVDHDRCRIQFDRPELGVEFVKDIDCMPLNPMENIPTSLKRHGVNVDKFYEALKQFQVNEISEDKTTEDFIRFTPAQKMIGADVPSDNAPAHLMNGIPKELQEAVASPSPYIKGAHNEVVSPQQIAASQLSALTQMQAKEGDIRALAELARALDKKHALVTELKRMNDDVSEDSSLKDVDSFKKQYAAILVQLNEVLDQVSSALMCLRQRNTYQGNSPIPWHKSMTLDDRCSLSSATNRLPCDSQTTGSHVCEIVETSRMKARKMVDAAIQAVSSLRNGSMSIQKIEDAIDYVNNRLSVGDFNLPVQACQINGTSAHQNSPTSCASKLEVSDQGLNSRSIGVSAECEIPSELVAHCVATLLMIQKCTERQFPPAEVAQILDFAVSGLQPRCSQNLPMYVEIQKCMGIIRSQILALVPT